MAQQYIAGRLDLHHLCFQAVQREARVFIAGFGRMGGIVHIGNAQQEIDKNRQRQEDDDTLHQQRLPGNAQVKPPLQTGFALFQTNPPASQLVSACLLMR